jgi:hypothetical protein
MDDENIQNNIKLFKLLDNHITDTHTHIKNMVESHKYIYELLHNKYDSNNYNLYIDDIYFNKNIISKEINNIETMRMLILRKFYGDLYRLYTKIIKYYLLIKEKKSYDNESITKIYFNELHIRTFSEIDILTIYRYRDIENIYLQINNHIMYIQKIYDETEKLLKDMNNKTKDFNITTFVKAYNCENNKIEAEINIFKTILSHITEKNRYLVEKLIKRTTTINDDITLHNNNSAVHITFESVSDGEESEPKKDVVSNDIENQMEEQIQNNNDITNSYISDDETNQL